MNIKSNKKSYSKSKFNSKKNSFGKTFSSSKYHSNRSVCLYELMYDLENNDYPSSMGTKQSKELDSFFPELYRFNTYSDLKRGLSNHPDSNVNNQEMIRYFTYKWFLLKCTFVDKQLLSQAGFKLQFDNQSKSQQLFFNNVPFELRETKCDRNLFVDDDTTKEYLTLDLDKLKEYGEFLYSNQSKSRYSLQNKVFVVYYSENKDVPTNKLRTCFRLKLNAFKQMCNNINKCITFKAKIDDKDAVCYFVIVHCNKYGIIKTYIPGLNDDSI